MKKFVLVFFAMAAAFAAAGCSGKEYAESRQDNVSETAVLIDIVGSLDISGEADTAKNFPEDKPSSKHINSSNGNFRAVVFFNDNVTRIGRVVRRGNTSWPDWIWSMAGAPEHAWLSNDGMSLVAGYEGFNLASADYRKDQVMFSFYREGELTRQIRLNELISDFSQLQRIDANYRWATYIEANVCGFLAVETVEGRKILFNMTTGIPIEFLSEPDRIKG